MEMIRRCEAEAVADKCKRAASLARPVRGAGGEERGLALVDQTVVEDAQKHLSLGEIQKVLQGLLREQVSIRNLVAILETLADYAGITKDPGFLVEKARQSLGRASSSTNLDPSSLS